MKRQAERWEAGGATIRANGRTTVSHWPVETASRAQSDQPPKPDGPAPIKAAWCYGTWILVLSILIAQGWLNVILGVALIACTLWAARDEGRHALDEVREINEHEARITGLQGQLRQQDQQISNLQGDLADFLRIAGENDELRAELADERRARTAEARRPRSPLWGWN